MYLCSIALSCSNVVAFSIRADEDDDLITTTNPACEMMAQRGRQGRRRQRKMVGVSQETEPLIGLQTGGDVGVVREGEEEDVYDDNVP